MAIDTNFKSHVMARWAPKPEAKSVEPRLFNRESSYVYRCQPAAAWQEANTDLRCYSDPADAGASVSKNEDASGSCSIDQAWNVSIKEFVFPGNETREVLQRYIYILKCSDSTPYAEIFAQVKDKAQTRDPGAEWRFCWQPAKTAEPKDRVLGEPLPPVVTLPPGQYGFFISPIRLSARALSYLCDHLSECCVREDLEGSPHGLTVGVPCAYHWAEEAYAEFFAPRVSDYRRFTTDDQIQSANAVWGVLKEWIAFENDTLGVENNTDARERTAFRSEFDRYESELREEMDRSAAYLAGWLDSKWHRVVEMAGQDDEVGAALTCGHWAYLARDLNQAEPTRKLLQALVQDKQRFLCTHILGGGDATAANPWFEASAQPRPETSSQPSDPALKWTKRTVSAMGGLHSSLLPGHFAVAIKAKTLTEQKQLAALYEKTLEWMKFAKAGDMKGIIDGCRSEPNTNALWNRYQVTSETGAMRVPNKGDTVPRVYRQIQQHADELDTRIQQLDDQIDVLTRRTGDRWLKSVAWVKKLRVPLDVVLAVGVAAIEVSALSHSLKLNQELSITRQAGLVKAGADIARSMVQVAEFLKKRSLQAAGVADDALTLALKGLRKGVAALAIVSGICEMKIRRDKASAEWGREDWGAFVGQGTALLGAAFGVAGGVMVWCTAGGGTILGLPGAGVGAIVGAVGAGLVLIGALIASFWRRNEYEDFARGSCLGDVTVGSGQMDVSWNDRQIWYRAPPATNIRSLYTLLSNFRVWVEGNGKAGSKLIIEPGLLSAGDCIRLHMVQRRQISVVSQAATGAVVGLSTFGWRTVTVQLEINPQVSRNATVVLQPKNVPGSVPGHDYMDLDTPRVTPPMNGRPARIEISLDPRAYHLWSLDRYHDVGASGTTATFANCIALIELERKDLGQFVKDGETRPPKSDLPRLPITADKFVYVDTADLAQDNDPTDGPAVISSLDSKYHGKLN